MPFLLSFEGRDARTDDLTLKEAIWVKGQCGKDWPYLRPIACAEDARAMLAVLLMRDGMSESDACIKAEMVTIRELLAMATWVDEDLPVEYEDGIPKAADDQVTTGSSGVPGGSDGPPT